MGIFTSGGGSDYGVGWLVGWLAGCGEGEEFELRYHWSVFGSLM